MSRPESDCRVVTFASIPSGGKDAMEDDDTR